MCDCSLMAIPSRLAAEGEQLAAHRFKSGTIGLVSLEEFKTWHGGRSLRLRERIKDCFFPEIEPAPVVCVPPGARLRLENVPTGLHARFGLDACEETTLTQLSAELNRHRDALRFANGATALLQLLPEGQIMTALRCSPAEDVEPSPDGVESSPIYGPAANHGFFQSCR
jgi:hypothetical protein